MVVCHLFNLILPEIEIQSFAGAPMICLEKQRQIVYNSCSTYEMMGKYEKANLCIQQSVKSV